MSAAGCEAVFALQGATERSLERIATLLARTEAE
jgi:hypothetical protein